MKYPDHHVHTRYSPDSEAPVEGYLLRAKERGLDRIFFTDHCDFGTTDPKFAKLIDYDEYFQIMEPLQEKYQLAIKIGVEVGYEREHKREINSFLKSHPFEFVIASIHYGAGGDFYEGSFFQGRSQREAYMSYFEILLEMVENFHNYDVVGHLDYIIRYGPFEKKDYAYRDYREIIDRILKAVIENGKGIEVNTSGLRQKAATVYPKAELLKRYRELGGKIITIGSDAHYNEHYYAGVEESMAILGSLGYDQICCFEKRKGKAFKLQSNSRDVL